MTPANNYKPVIMIMGGGNPATNTTELIDLVGGGDTQMDVWARTCRNRASR